MRIIAGEIKVILINLGTEKVSDYAGDADCADVIAKVEAAGNGRRGGGCE